MSRPNYFVHGAEIANQAIEQSVAQRRKAFRALHNQGCFVVPNPWDIGSAKLLAGMGFKALASSSAGYAWSQGQADGTLSRDDVLEHLRHLVMCVDVPINADFERGFASSTAQLEESVRLVIETGVAGFSLEDATGDPATPLMPIEEAADRIRVARAAIEETGQDVVLVGRAENFFVGVPDFDDVIARLTAYAEAGADCLYAPGLRSAEQIQAVVSAVAPKPVNVLIGWNSPLTVRNLAALGVRRISVGGALARTAWNGFLHAARQIAEHGRFDGLTDDPSGTEMNRLLG